MNTVDQTWDPRAYARNASFVPELGASVMKLLAPQPGERILDLGCGDGVLTERLQQAGCEVVGVDASQEQVEAARARGVSARVLNGQALDYAPEFHAVFSNAALHWMRDADAVIEGVYRALLPGGRFVAELGGHGNVAKIRQALAAALERRGIDAAALDPWYFPTAQGYARRLRAAGFQVRSIVLFERPTPLPTGIEAWLQTFAQSQLAAVPARQRPGLLAEVRAQLEPRLHTAQGWVADYVRLRFAADKLGEPGPARTR